MQGVHNSLGHFADRKLEQNVFWAVSESSVIGLNDRVVRVTAGSGAITLTLPAVGGAYGCVISIEVPGGATGAVTIQDQDDSIGWTDLTYDGDDEGVLLFCDGRKWWTLSETVAAP